MKPAIKAMPLDKQTKMGEAMLRDIEAMLLLRFSGSNWEERFKQFREENDKRPS